MRTIELEVLTKGSVSRLQHFTGPSSWKDLTRENLLVWAGVMCSDLKQLQAKGILAAKLFGFPKHSYLKDLDRKERCRLSMAVAFLFNRNRLEQWLLPVITYGIRKYHGPKSRLSNITSEEYTLCELCFEKFQMTKDIACLDLLIAILYRPRRWVNIDNDIRVQLTTIGVEKRAEKFKNLPIALKWAIYLNYEGCRNYIIDSNKEIFTKGGSGGKVSVTPWAKILRNGAGGIFGTLNETEKTNVHKFLAELNARLKENREKQQP